jgi:hypothetical protein
MAQPKKMPKPKKDARTKKDLLAEIAALTTQNAVLANDIAGLERALEEDRKVHREERTQWLETEDLLRGDREGLRRGEATFRELANKHATANEKLRGEVEELTAIATAIVAAAAMEFSPMEFTQAVTAMLEKVGQTKSRNIAQLLQQVVASGYAAGVKHNMQLMAVPVGGGASKTGNPMADRVLADLDKKLGVVGGRSPSVGSLLIDHLAKLVERGEEDGCGDPDCLACGDEPIGLNPMGVWVDTFGGR